MINKSTKLDKSELSVFLHDTLHDSAFQTFSDLGYKPKSMDEKELVKNIGKANFIGIRSTIQIKNPELEKAQNLFGIGCYTVGYNNVKIDQARKYGIPVFNSPYDSTRSVAEGAMGRIFALAQKLSEHNSNMHNGKWIKLVGDGSMEILGKTLGIIGYGNIGSQLGQIATSNGMDVMYFDIRQKQSYGTNKSCKSLKEVLEESDFISLHVPETPETIRMIGKKELSLMKKGSFLINTSRGKVVDLNALEQEIKSGRLAGAALDVFPDEPKNSHGDFINPLTGYPNVLLTPHICGSSQEAQERIGISVSKSLIKFYETGNTDGAICFPNVHLDHAKNSYRILYIHRNLPGADAEISEIISKAGLNVNSKMLKTEEDIGYLIIDIDKDSKEIGSDLENKIKSLDKYVKLRFLD